MLFEGLYGVVRYYITRKLIPYFNNLVKKETLRFVQEKVPFFDKCALISVSNTENFTFVYV